MKLTKEFNLFFIKTAIIVFVAALSFFWATPAHADDMSGWSHSKQISISNTNVSSTLSYFPLLVHLPGDTDVGGGVSDTTHGYDIRFTASDKTTVLPYEREDFSVSSGAATGDFWVQVSSISSSAPTVIWIFYGNSSVSGTDWTAATSTITNCTTITNAQCVWNENGANNYKGTWHLPNGTTLSATDSTSNANNGTATGTTPPTATTGKIDGGANFNGVNSEKNFIALTSAPTTGTGSFSAFAWAKTSASALRQQILQWGGDSGASGNGVWLYVGTDNKVHTDLSGIAGPSSSGTVNDGNYHLVGVVNNAGTFQIYVDGAASGSTSSLSPNLVSDYKEIGGPGQGSSISQPWYFNGSIDEVRVSATVRSTAWIKFEYCNMLSTASGSCAGGNELTIGTSLSSGTSTIYQNTTGNSITLTGTGTSWTSGSPGSPTFTLSGGTGASITSQSVASATSATIVVNAGSTTGTLTITDPSTGNTVTVTVAAPSLSSDTSTIYQSTTGNSIILTGGGTSWTSGSPGSPTFTLSGGTGASITSQSVASATSATIVVNAGSTTGTLTITDPSTGKTTTVTVAPAACPGDISGCTLWLDAAGSVYSDAGTTLAANGATVQQWNDKSGRGFNAVQNTSGQRPTYLSNVGGHPALQFSSSTRMLVGANSDFTSSAFTVFAVFQRTGDKGYQAILNKGDGATAAGSTWALMASAADNNVASLDTFYGSTNNSNGYAGSTKLELITGKRIDSTHKVIYKNHAQVATGSDSGNSLNAGQFPLGIGNSGSTGSTPLVGYIRALVYYPSALSDADRKAVENSLIDAYDVPFFDTPGFYLSTATSGGVGGTDILTTSDGVTFTPPSGVTDPIVLPGSPDNLASSLMYYQGKYWLAYEENAFSGTQTTFAIANATSLGGPYSLVMQVPVLNSSTNAYVWNPRWFIDDDASIHINVNVESLVTFDTAFQPYILDALNANLTSWSAPTAVGGTYPGNLIDTFIISPANSPNGKYNIWYKNEPTRQIEYMSSTSLKSGYTTTQTGNWNGWGSGFEGVLLKKDRIWRLYATLTGSGIYRYCDDQTTNWGSFSDLTASISASDSSGPITPQTGSILPLTSADQITSFNFTSPSATGTVNNSNNTIAITVPAGTNVTSLAPTIAVTSQGEVVVTPASGVAQDFTNPKTYTVIANNVVLQTYTVTVTVAPSTDATLSNLTISSGTLTPAFASGTTSYTDSVANSVNSVTVTPTVNQANATVKVNGTTVSSGSASGSISLSVGSNTITTVVTAQNGTTTDTYTITVTRADASPTYTLTITSSNGTVAKDPSQSTYTSGTSVSLTATANTGYTFSSWSGDATGSANPLTVTMSANKTITANFTAVSSTKSGSVSLSAVSTSTSIATGKFTVSFANGSRKTSTRNVTLILHGNDDIVNMAISNTPDFKDVSQEPYRQTKQWLLPAGDGQKTVYVKFYDKQGQASQVMPVAITLDTLSSSNSESASPHAITKVLNYGVRNYEVMMLQKKLQQLGFFPDKVQPNGNFGPTTLKAVQDFQLKNKITKRGIYGFGIVGPRTRQALNSL